MRPVKFRITNYKSIIDTGEGGCWLASDITTLAGKNESGKTAILEALRDFSPDVELTDSIYPLNGNETCEITFWFGIDEKKLNEIFTHFKHPKLELIKKHILENFLLVTKTSDFLFGYYDFDKFINQLLDEYDAKLFDKIRELVLASLPGVRNIVNIDVDESKISASNCEDFIIYFRELTKIIDEQLKSTPIAEEHKSVITSFKEISSKFDSTRYYYEFNKIIMNNLPKIIFYSSFDGMLPFEIDIKKATENQSVKDYCTVSGLSIKKLEKESDKQRKINYLATKSASISGDFKEYWRQDNIDIITSLDGQNLIFGIKQLGTTEMFKPEQRSKGFQWFLSFYLRLKAEGGDNSIILIDEPGLYLHAKAQSDVLDVLKNIAKKSKIIMSTHSPYLIEPDRLDRVWLVIKNINGTIISKWQNAHEYLDKNAFKETVTPLITAIGIDISKGLQCIGSCNVVVEGITEYYYLNAMKQILNNKNELCIFPCTGAPSMRHIASMMIAWNANVYYLFDNDKAGRDAYSELLSELHIEKNRLIFVSKDQEHAIEDIFTTNDFNKYISVENPTDGTKRNSKAIVGGRHEKSLLAKRFYEKSLTDKLEFEKESIENFKDLFSLFK